MSTPASQDFAVERLGVPRFPSPVMERGTTAVGEDERVLAASTLEQLEQAGEPLGFERAGPRAQLVFEPGKTRAGIVTCGGLCPGVNNVIRALVLTLHHGYGVHDILGFRYGYAGLAAKRPAEPIDLTPELVESLHEQGGTLLGSSRGPQDLGEVCATLEDLDVDLLFTIGGDGTLRGASALVAELARRGRKTAVVGVPKTIDNDIQWIERSFGFATAVEEARRVILAAHAEARGAWNGVGLVKLMGRHSGFITAHASLASNDVNFCLVPEVPFRLEGKGGFLAALERRLEDRRHAVVAVAEGAAQDLLQDPANQRTDASGNLRLEDVGVFLRDSIRNHFRSRNLPITVKYIDPSYTIRSQPAGALDAELCLMLGQHAAHAAMAGRTHCMIGYWNRRYTHVPMDLATGERRQIDPEGPLWARVLGATGQPHGMAS